MLSKYYHHLNYYDYNNASQLDAMLQILQLQKDGFDAMCFSSVQYCKLVCHLVFLTFHYPTSSTVFFSYRKNIVPYVFRKVFIPAISFLGSE